MGPRGSEIWVPPGVFGGGGGGGTHINSMYLLLIRPKSFICFGDRVSLGVPKCPGIHYIDQAGLELEAIPHGMLGGWPPR